jgi:flavin-dependent dehydrogenase
MTSGGDILVIGGGPAGAALAAELAARGRAVTLAERSTAPQDKMCGEFLSYEAGLYLNALGIDARALGAVPLETFHVAAGPYSAEIRLPFPALSLSRRVLDEALLGRAIQAGAGMRRGARVAALTQTGTGWEAALDGGDALSASALFLATGKHDLRGWKRTQGGRADFVGFKLHWRLSPGERTALAGRVEMFLFPGGYAGLTAIEEARANLCLVVRQNRFSALGGTWAALLAAVTDSCPLLARRLTGAQACWDRPLAIAAIPYGHVQRAPENLWRLGDQAAVLPSFAGDGIALALHSARLAARHFLAGDAPAAYRRAFARDIGPQMRRATVLSRLGLHPWGQKLLVNALRLRPKLIGAMARATRIPAHALIAIAEETRDSGC